jgi:prepilin-type N-terminal cleavage/methylation domain-containing protein
MSNAFSSSSGRRGLTLVEVIAGLVLLATLLTAVLAAFKTHATQIRGARERLKASATAEELVSGWAAQGALPAVGTQKPLPGTDGWFWRVLANESPLSGPVKTGTVRVEIIRPRDAAGDDVLASVVLVVPGNTSVAK